MPLILGAQSAVSTGYSIDNSCRFNGADSTELHYTQGTPTDNNTWTFSCWFKRASTTTERALFGTTPSGNITKCRIMADATVQFLDNQSGDTGKLTTNRLLRDSSAWMHMVCVWDSDNGAAGDRVRMYINGTEETSFSTDTQPSSGQATIWNTASQVANVGRDNDGNYWDGYMADVVFIDGTAYAASDFGEFNEDSPTIWQPKDPSGLTFGNNGFWLDFKDSADLGNDVSGVGNDLTVTNLIAADQGVDSPTNNFCTVVPAMSPTKATIYAYGNTFVEADNIDVATCCAFGLTKGSWYMEAKATDTNNTTIIGLVPAYLINSVPTSKGFDIGSANNTLNMDPSVGIRNNGNLYEKVDGSQVTVTTTSYTTGDIIGFAFNLDTGALRFWVDGVEMTGSPYTLGDGSYSSTNWVTSGPMLPGFRLDGGAVTILAGWECNFGNGFFGTTAVVSTNEDAAGIGSFEYEVPASHYALCTKNIKAYG